MEVLKVSKFFMEDIPPLILGGFFSRRLFTKDIIFI